MKHPCILGLDPGPSETGYVVYDGHVIVSGHEANGTVLERVRRCAANPEADILAAETFRHYGPHRPIGKTVLDGMFWLGRFYQEWLGLFGRTESTVRLVSNPDIRHHFCGRQCNESAIHAAVKQRLGEAETKGINKHALSALAVALYAADYERVYGKRTA
jgi:hypothetical protein